MGAWIDKPIFEEESGLKTEIHSLIDVGTTVKKSRCNHQCKHTGGVWAGPQKSQHSPREVEKKPMKDTQEKQECQESEEEEGSTLCKVPWDLAN